jgi:hypothetical protein
MKRRIQHCWRQIQFYLTVVIAIGGISLFCSCKKSEKDEVMSAANNAAKAAGIAITNWAITNGVNLQTNSQIATAVETFPKVIKMAITNEVHMETGRAGLILKQLHEQGRLPGDSKDEHGKLTSGTFDLVVSNKATVITYPTSRTFHLVKDGDTSTNNYTLVKLSKDSEWKLQKAWQTDSNGTFVKEWPIQ